MYYIGSIPVVETDIQHFGIKGMKWGVRRYQNEDGSLTTAGKARYYVDAHGEYKHRSAKQSGFYQGVDAVQNKKQSAFGYKLKTNIVGAGETFVKSYLATSAALEISKLMGKELHTMVAVGAAIVANIGTARRWSGKIKGADAARQAKKQGFSIEIPEGKRGSRTKF